MCKVYDETSKQDDEELDFQWKEGFDTDVSFQLRLTDLYKNGMEVFLSRIVSDFDEQEFENKYKHLSKETKDENTSLDMQVKINLDLLPYIYPKRKSIDMNSNDMPEVKIFINHEEVGVESKEHF